ncbi:hypothetical protein Pcinc_015505 [Petrolisthes cinctipes]|uniref:Mitochondrial ribosomal protein L2 n=1 Tax=Petrolisthes cinctipes TaxID=88211 RepID=A0AAE1FY75_PETCI|nr:hypothetical protein Pcinc_015505 [Petrolisthes cinctipes]
MSVASVASVCRQMATLTLRTKTLPLVSSSLVKCPLQHQQVRWHNMYRVDQPRPMGRLSYRFKVHYPEDGQYTVRPLKSTKLAGRHPETGRIIIGTLGGGAKRNYRWIDWFRTGPSDGFFEERVIHVQYDPNRSSRIALVAGGEHLRYILATVNMQAGDLIRTTSHLPRIPVRPKEGDAHPVGALPNSTLVNSIEVVPGDGARFVKAAGTAAVVMRRVKDKVVVQLPSKREIALDPNCMVTVGRLSNLEHGSKHVGSAQRRRWLGRRPASGLWQRKDGYCGRKIRPVPPMITYGPRKEELPMLKFDLPGEGPTKKITPSTDRVS